MLGTPKYPKIEFEYQKSASGNRQVENSGSFLNYEVRSFKFEISSPKFQTIVCQQSPVQHWIWKVLEPRPQGYKRFFEIEI